MPPWPSEQAKARGSANGSVGKHNLELGEDHVPVLAPGMPVLDDPLGSQIEHPAQGIIVGKAGLVFGDLAELAVETLNDVRRVYDLPNFGRIFIKGTQDFPVLLPAFHAGGILSAPLFSELEQSVLRLVQGDGGVDFLQVSHYLLDKAEKKRNIKSSLCLMHNELFLLFCYSFTINSIS